MTRPVKLRGKSILVSLPLILILGLSFLIFLPIQHVNATTPSLNRIQTNFSAGSISSYITGSAYNPQTNCGGVCNGLTYVVESLCYPDASISSITDTLGNTYIKIASEGGGTGTHSIDGELWYAIESTTASTSNTVTINLATNAAFCTGALFYSTVPMSVTNMFSGVFGQIHFSNPIGTVPTLNINVNSNTFTFSGTSQYEIFNFGFSNTTAGTDGTNFIAYTGIAPLVNYLSSNDNQCASGLQNFINCRSSQTVITPTGSTFTQKFTTNIVATNNPTITYAYGVLTVVLSTQTVSAPNCTNCGLAGGGLTKDSTTTFTLSMPNETLLYTFDSPVGGASIQNVTTEVASYTNAGLGKNIDFIYICIYELPQRTLQGINPITSSNQLKQSQCVLNNAISTGQTNQFIHWYPNVLIPPSTTYAITIMSRFAGMSLYGATDTITLQGDIADYIGGGVPPIAISNFFTVIPPVWFNFIGSQTSIINTVTATTTLTFCASGATCNISTITNTVAQVSTLIIYRMNGSNGAVANIQDITAFLPVWVLPLIMGALFGVTGLLFGAIMGVVLGAVLGVVPLWAAFLLGLGIVYLLFRKGGF